MSADDQGQPVLPDASQGDDYYLLGGLGRFIQVWRAGAGRYPLGEILQA
jgi:hypothetical protein